ncbi:MAG: S-methyl-5'-thioadenosine phosphorylase [Chloroflexi bacterium]|nr:S-methyl-5'-thioadenosine phosphorylase [Chloroflexota bacterium]
MPEAKIGIIGGSGLYEMDGLTDVQDVQVDTPFGKPSDAIMVGKLEGQAIAFLPRHGRGHRISPTNLPVRANIHALKSLGVEWIVSVSSAGSLKDNIHPLDLVIPDQIIDRTKSRVNSFFEEPDAPVVHVGFADPYCPLLSQIVYEAAAQTKGAVHKGGTYVVMEGPLFSTRAESNLYRSWGASVIGMTTLPEAKLAREAEICYTTIACVTDFDCWHETEESVTVDMIIGNLLRNVDRAKAIVRKAAGALPIERTCVCATALRDAIITSHDLIPPEAKERLRLLIGKYVQ